MLKTLPSILTAPAQAATAALSGKTAHLDPAAGAGFARLMQQHTAPAPARPVDSRPNPDTARPPSSGASPAASTGDADKRRAERALDNAPSSPAERSTAAAGAAGAAGAADPEDRASASLTASKSADSRSTASQPATNPPARARQAAQAGRTSAADGAAAPAGAMPPGSTADDSPALPDTIDAPNPGDPVPAPNNSPAAALAQPSSVLLPSADPVAAALLAEAADGAGTAVAGTADSPGPRGPGRESTASWVAAQQRQRDTGGSAAGDRSAGGSAGDVGDASGRTRRSTASVRTAASGTTADDQPSAAAWAARLAAEPAAPAGAALPAGWATASPGSTGGAGTQPDTPAAPMGRAAPRLASGPEAADRDPGAPASGGATAAGAARSGPGFDGSPASTVALATAAAAVPPGSDAPQAGLDAAVPPSTPAKALATPDAPPRPAAAPQPGVFADSAGDTAPDRLGQAKAHRAAEPDRLAAAIGPDSSTGAVADSHKPTPQAAAATGAAPGPGADATARRSDGMAVATAVPTPAQAASAVAVSGADMPGGPSRTATLDRAAENPANSTAPDVAGRDDADRDSRPIDRLGGARPDPTAPTLSTGLAPNAAAVLQTPAGADGPSRDHNSASAVPTAVGVNTAQSAPATATATATATTGMANTPAAAATAMAEARIAVPADSPAFAPALGAQVSLFAKDGVQTARLQINPAEMGPITVQIALDGNTARVDFQADRAATRDLIEASLPALAGAMQDAGLTLTGGGVFQQHPGRQPPPERSPTANTPRDPTPDSRPDSGAADPAFAGRRGTQRGLVDLVA